jgi:hypothetical protein
VKKISVRLAKPEDTAKFLEYEFSTPNNLFDPESGLYPSSLTLCAENEHGPLMFLPIQRPFVLESLGILKDASKKEIAVSLRRLIDQLVEFAKQAGVGELAFICKEPSTEAFAVRHGFEKLPWNLYRMRVKDYQ